MDLKQAGTEKAAQLWETLEHLPVPAAPINVYKAASAMKCSEFVARIRTHYAAVEIMGLLVKFLEDTLALIGGADAGDVSEGARVLNVVMDAMPLTDEIFNDPAAYAQRQHVYDALLMLAAVPLGKEAETKKCIDDLRDGVANASMAGYLKELGIDPDKPQSVN